MSSIDFNTSQIWMFFGKIYCVASFETIFWNNSLELPGFGISNSLLCVLEESRELTALVRWVGLRSIGIQECKKNLPYFFFLF